LVLESWVIILILTISLYLFARSGKRGFTGGILPLMLVPFVNIVYSPFSREITERYGEVLGDEIRIAAYIVALAAAGVWMFIWSVRIPSSRARYAYIIVSLSFTIALILIFIRRLVFSTFGVLM
jgi:hypothetical protein